MDYGTEPEKYCQRCGCRLTGFTPNAYYSLKWCNECRSILKRERNKEYMRRYREKNKK